MSKYSVHYETKLSNGVKGSGSTISVEAESEAVAIKIAEDLVKSRNPKVAEVYIKGIKKVGG